MKFKEKFVISFIVLMICTQLVLVLASNIINSIIFNSRKWEGASFIIPSTLVVCFLFMLGVFISTYASMNMSAEKNSEYNYDSTTKFFIIFFVVLAVANLAYQFLFYQKSFNIALSNINTITYRITGDNTIITESKKTFLFMSIIKAILSNMFILLMIPFSIRKMKRIVNNV